MLGVRGRRLVWIHSHPEGWLVKQIPAGSWQSALRDERPTHVHESSPVPADFEDCECAGSLRPAGARERKTRPHTRLRVLQTVSFAPAFYGEVPPAVHLLPLLLHAECASAKGCYDECQWAARSCIMGSQKVAFAFQAKHVGAGNLASLRACFRIVLFSI